MKLPTDNGRAGSESSDGYNAKCSRASLENKPLLFCIN